MDHRLTDPERTFVVRDGGRDRGDRREPDPRADGARRGACRVAGVSAIGVVPGHTRRGHLTRDDAPAARGRARGRRARGGAVGVGGRDLRPLRLRHRHARDALRRCSSTASRSGATRRCPSARAQTLEPAAALERMRALLRARAARAARACSTAAGAWWDRRIFDPEHRRDGAGPLRAAIQPGDDGEPAGYALFSRQDRPGTTTARPAASRCASSSRRRPRRAPGLWRFLLGLDLVRTLQWRLAPDHDPLAHLLDRQRRGRPARRRRPVRAAARRRRRARRRAPTRPPFDLVLEVDDAVLPVELRPPPAARRPLRAHGRARRPRARRGGARRRSTSAAPRSEALAAAGRVRELRAGALLEAATAFRGARRAVVPGDLLTGRPGHAASGPSARGGRGRRRRRPPWPGPAVRRCRARASPSARGRAARGRRSRRRRGP